MQFKNQTLEAEEISKFKEKIGNFSKEIKKSEYFEQFHDNFLNILGFSYRLEDAKQQLFYTFQEAVYAIDLAKLTRDEDALLLNSVVYILVLEVLIAQYLNESIDEELKTKAITFYKELEAKKTKENQKYHVYQY